MKQQSDLLNTVLIAGKDQNESQTLMSKILARQISIHSQPLLSRSISASIKLGAELHAYKRRFIMIILSLLLCITNAYLWIQFASMADKLTKYYGISNLKVNFFSIIYFCVYITCIIPATKIIERKGLRFSIILGASLNFISTLIKCCSLNRDSGFTVALIGQFFSGLACLLLFNIPPEIASTWFKSEEVSRVVSLEVCSCFIGNIIAFFLPTLIFGNNASIEEIAEGLFKLHFGAMCICFVLLFLVIILFEERPPVAPSLAEYYRILSKKTNSNQVTSIESLLQNKNLLIFIFYSSINAGVFDSFVTLLNQMILIEFPNDSNKVGTIGILFILSGMLGSLFCGYLLDKFHKYKEISVTFYGMSILFLILFMLKLHFSSITMTETRLEELVKDQSTANNVLLHIYIFGLGFFLIGYWTIRFDFGIELAYPSAASTVCGFTAASCDLFGILFTLISSKIIDTYGTLISNLILVGLLSIGMYSLCTMKPDYKRQTANAMKKPLINPKPSYNSFDNNTDEAKILFHSNNSLDERTNSLMNGQEVNCTRNYNVCFKFQSNPVLVN